MLVLILVGLIIINYLVRSNLDLETGSVYDVIALPTLGTILIAMIILGLKVLKKSGPK